MHIYEMFNEMHVMASRGLFKSLFNYFHLYHFFYVTFHLWKFHGVLGDGLSSHPKKVVQNLESLAENYLEKSLVAHMPCCGSDWRVPVACMLVSRERLRL